MPIMRRFRPVSVVLSAVIVSALVGGLFGSSLLATDQKIPDHYKRFTAALSAIETNYVDKVDSERLIYGAVRGMLAAWAEVRTLPDLAGRDRFTVARKPLVGSEAPLECRGGGSGG